MKNVLTGVEFLCLKMQSTPGQSTRFYRGHLSQYKTGKFNSEHNSGYFTRQPGHYLYFGNLWVDCGPKDRQHQGFCSTYPMSSVSQIYLTRRGWKVANRARRKLAMQELKWDDCTLPQENVHMIYQTGV